MTRREREAQWRIEPGDRTIIAAIRAAGVRRVAERAGVSKTFVSLWLNGRVWAPESTAKRIIMAAGLTDWGHP